MFVPLFPLCCISLQAPKDSSPSCSKPPRILFGYDPALCFSVCPAPPSLRGISSILQCVSFNRFPPLLLTADFLSLFARLCPRTCRWVHRFFFANELPCLDFSYAPGPSFPSGGSPLACLGQGEDTRQQPPSEESLSSTARSLQLLASRSPRGSFQHKWMVQTSSCPVQSLCQQEFVRGKKTDGDLGSRVAFSFFPPSPASWERCRGSVPALPLGV